MAEPLKEIAERARQEQPIPTVSAVLPDGSLLETIYDGERRETAFLRWHDGQWTRESSVSLEDSTRQLVPYSPQNNLLRNGVVLFPSGAEDYGTERELVEAIRDFLHRYVDVSPLFEKLASYYVLLSWVYDAFNELPYLRVRGDPGSGKTRFLLVVGSVCYKPIFASGASTVSPLFRLLDTFRGTLVIDEGDFRFSDERAEIVKILNNGNARGFPVLRSEATGKRGEFNPRAYHVFGPKLIATRGFFEDRALESRCLTEEMGGTGLREDIPINLPAGWEAEALRLRNQLLLFRFRNLSKCRPDERLVDRTIEPRLNQVFVPLLSVVDDATTRAELRDLARRYHRELVTDRGMEMEAQVLEIVNELALAGESGISIKDITQAFIARHAEDYERKITTKWIGTIVRRRLGLRAAKVHGVFTIGAGELQKLPRLREKYGLGHPDESSESAGDVG